MDNKSSKQNEEINISLEDEKRLRDRTYELFIQLEMLRSKPDRSPQEQRRYELIKDEYNAMYEEYVGKFAGIMDADREQQRSIETPQSSKLMKATGLCLGVMMLLVAAVVVFATLKNSDGKRLAQGSDEYVKWDGEGTALGEGYKIAADDPDAIKYSGGNTLEGDRRVPDLMSLQNVNQTPERRHFSWTARDGATVLTWNPQLYTETYKAYKNADRYFDSKDFYRYISDSNNERLLLEIAHTLESIGEGMGYSQWELANEAMNFIQNIEFVTDMESTGREEWPKYVTETVYDECGDCEDKAIFLAGILKTLNYDVVLIAFDGHLGVGIAGDDNIDGVNYEYKGRKYFYIEPSYPGWEIGQLPANVDTAQVVIIPI